MSENQIHSFQLKERTNAISEAGAIFHVTSPASAFHPLRTFEKSASLPLMYRLQAAILRSFQVLGVVMALAAGVLAVGLVNEGKGGALFSAGLALAMVAFVLLAGWMPKRAKKHANLFPPSVR